jgi:predicted enzyme related to lactoylglutathione lyase
MPQTNAETHHSGEVAIEGLITFLYYKDLATVARFYEDVLGLSLAIDQGFARIYQVAEKAYLGIVDETRGYHRANTIKPVEITLVVPDVDAWYRRIRGMGVETLCEPHDIPGPNVRAFLLHDPEGYVIEIQKFL